MLIALMLLPIVGHGPRHVGRREGALLLAVYPGYVVVRTLRG